MAALLEPGERFEWLVRPHAIVWGRIRALELTLIVLGLVGLGIMLSMLSQSGGRSLLVAWSLVAGGVVLVVLAAFFERGWYQYHVYGATQRRLFVQTGRSAQRVRTFALRQVARCDVDQNAWDRLFRRGTGTLRIQLSTDSSLRGGWAPSFQLRHLEDPEGIRRRLRASVGRADSGEEWVR